MISSYFNIVKIQQQINVLNENIKINDDRIKIAQKRFEIGSASKLEMLQATVDRNTRLAEILALKKELDNAMVALNRLLGKTEFSDFILTDSISITYQPEYNDLRKSVLNTNKEIFLYSKNAEINKKIIRESQAARYPQLDLNLNYNYSQVKNEVGFSLLNQNKGFNAGLTLSWNIFNGFNTSREIQNAKLNFQSAQLLLQDTRSSIDFNVYAAYRRFLNDLELSKLQQSNIEFARENVTVALEAYRIGSISGIQLKEAQNSYESANAGWIESQYQAKLSETELMKLNGELVK